MLLRQLYVSFYFLMIRRPPRSTLFPTRRSSDLVRQGQKVMVLPGGLKSAVKEIWTYDGSRMEAFCPQSITLVLEDDIDVSRGDMVVGLDALPGMNMELTSRVCWMHPRPLQAGRKFLLKQTSQTVQAVVTALESRINIQTFDP